MKFTIFGSSGYLGSSLKKELISKKIECVTPDPRCDKILDNNLGHVIYAIGVPDFHKDPFKTIDAHVILLNKILKEQNFESFLYLSSTRLYHNALSTAENSRLNVNPSYLDDLYNISKIMGESICNMSRKSNVRIVRLSNVTGNNFDSNTFLASIIRDAIQKKKIFLKTSLNSQKDYVYLNDVIDLLPKIAINGKHSIYNIASGQNLTNEELAKRIQQITKCKIQVATNAKKYEFPKISINLIKNEFNFKPTSILDKIDEIIKTYQKKFQ